MSKSRKFLPALAAVGLALGVSMAQADPVTFNVSAATITPGTGYGVDNGNNGENGGTLLDVLFGTTFALPQSFDLEAGGAGYILDLGTVNFREPNTGNGGNQGIRGEEKDLLEVVVGLTLDAPTPIALILNALVTAETGTISDAAVDYALAWMPLEVDFGNGGRFSITMNSLSFSNVGTQTLTATVSLLTAATDAPAPAVPVPEPATLALVAAALAGVGVSRRRRPI